MFSQFQIGTQVGMYDESGFITSGFITSIDDDGGFRINTEGSGVFSFSNVGTSFSGRYVLPLYPHLTTVQVAGITMVRIDGNWFTNLTVEGKRLILKELPAGEEITVLYHP